MSAWIYQHSQMQRALLKHGGTINASFPCKSDSLLMECTLLLIGVSHVEAWLSLLLSSEHSVAAHFSNSHLRRTVSVIAAFFSQRTWVVLKPSYVVDFRR